MDRRRAAGALLALAACIACSTAAPMTSNQTALDLYDGASEGCYYNFQHYGEGDRIMTNEPCLNCTCHNRMLMCYLRVCPFTKPIGQDCTVEKRADQCCPIVTCPDVPVDLLTSTSTSSPAEYGATGVGKQDKYGCSINGRYFPEGSKVPPTPNKPCEHCYCIRNMTTCVMQECTLHVDGCIPIYHKDVCCPVRYSCDHPEDEILLLDDMTTTVRPTPGFLLTTTTAPVTQVSQDCVHDNEIFADGALIQTEKACQHCYCMKGDIVCVVQECGTPMENEGKNCTSLPPRHGQCCPDTYICEGDELTTDQPKDVAEEVFKISSIAPPRRGGVEGSGYRNEPDEPYTDMPTTDTLEIEGSGEDQSVLQIDDIETPGKQTPDLADEMFLTTVKIPESKPFTSTAEPGVDQTLVPKITKKNEESGTEHSMLHEITVATESNKFDRTTEEGVPVDSETRDMETTHVTLLQDEKVTQDLSATTLSTSDYSYSSLSDSLTSREDQSLVTTEPTSTKENDVSTPTVVTTQKRFDEVTTESEHYGEKEIFKVDTEILTDTTVKPKDDDRKPGSTDNVPDTFQSKQTTTDSSLDVSTTVDSNKDVKESPSKHESSSTTVTDFAETTSRSPIENEIDEDVSPIHSSGRIPGEGDCLLSGITYRNNTTVPRTNKCHTSCKCISSIVKCDPIICSPPPEYANIMNNCQPIYDSAESCCPTYICDHSKETILSESHRMSGTEGPKPIYANECSGNECAETEENQPLSHIQSKPCTSENCVYVPEEKQPLVPDCGIGGCGDEGFDSTIPLKHPEDCSDGKCALPPKKDLPCNENTGCQVTVVKPCEGEDCVVQTEIIAKEERLLCQIQGNCKDKETPVTEDKIEKNCSTESCRRKGSSDIAVKLPSTCIGVQCEYSPNTEKTLQESTTDIPLITDEKTITNDRDIATTRIFEFSTIKPTEELISILEQNTETYDTSSKKIDIEMQELTTKYLDTVPDVTDFSITKELETLTSKQPETERVTGEYRPSIEVSTTSPDTLSDKDYLTTSFHNLLTEPTIAEENSESVQENILEKDKEEAREPQISSTEAATTFPELEEKHTTAPPKYLVTSTQQTTLFDYKKGTSRDEILEISTPAIDEHKYSTGPYITESVVNKEDDREYFDTHLSTASNILYYDGEQSTETLVSKADDTSSILLNEFAMKLPESHKYDDKTTDGDTTFETTDITNQYIETTDMSEEFIDVKTQDKTSTQESTVGISSNEEEPITENTIEENKLSQDKLPLEYTVEDKMPQTTEYAVVESQKIDSVTPEIEQNETTELTESIITGENTLSTKETDLEESYTKLPVMENTYASEISKTTESDLMESLNGRATELPEVDIEEKLQTGAPQLHESNLHTTDLVVSGYDETQTELFKPYTTESTMYTSQTAFVEGIETKMPEYNETDTTKIVTDTPTLVKTEPSKTDNVISELHKGVTENFESVPTVDASEKTTTEKIESLDHNLSDKHADGEKATETIDEITLRQELPSTMQFEGNAGIQSTESVIDSHKYTTQVSHILQMEEILPSSFEKEHEYHESERSTTGLYPEVEVKTETYTDVETTAKSEEQGTKEEYHTVTPTESFNEKITTQKQYLPSFTPTILPSFEHILHTSVPEQKVTESVALPVTEDILVESLPTESEQDLTTKLTVSEEDKVTKKPHSVELIDEPEFTIKDYHLSGIEEIEKATIVPVSDDSYSQDVVTSNIRLTSIEEKYDKTTAIPDITITEESHTDYLNMVTDKTSILPDLEDKKTVTNIPETFTTSVFVTERETHIDNLSITTARDQEEMTSDDPEKIYNVPSHTETPEMVTEIDNLNLQDIGKTTDFATLIIPTTNQTKILEIQTNKITGTPDKEETIKMTETPDLNILEQLQTVKSEHTTVKAPEIGILIEENTIKIEKTGVTEEYTTELSEKVTASKDNVQATDVPEKIATALLEYVTEKAFPTPQVEYTEKIPDTPERTYTGEISTELPDIFTATGGLIVNTQKVVTIPELVQVTSEPFNMDDNLELTNAPPQKVTVKPSEDLLESEIEKASKVPELEDQLALTEIPLQKVTDRPISWALQTGTEQLITKQVFTDTPQVVTENIKQSEDSDVSPMGAPTLTDTTHSKLPDYVKGVTKFADQDKTTDMPEKSISDIHGTNQMESATVINDLNEATKTTDASEFLIPVEASSFLPDTSSDNKLVTAVTEDKYTEQSTKLSVITTNKPSETVDNEANRITTVIPELVITEKTVDLLEDGLVEATESSIAKDTENYNPVTDSESTNIPEKTDVDKLATEVPDLHTTRISESETYGDAKPEISTQVAGLYSTLKHEPGETASETGVLESTKVSSGTIVNTDTYILEQYTTETPEQIFTKLHKPSTKISESLVTEHEWSNTEKSITATYSPEIHSSTTKEPEQEFTDEVHESSVTIPEIPITVKAESETQLPLHVSTEIQSTLSPDESHVTDDLMDVTKTPGTYQYTTVLHELTTEALHEETINKEITQTELPVSVDTSPEVIHNIPDETKMPVTIVTSPDISDVTEKLEASTQPNIEVSVEIDTGSNELESTPINEISELLEYSKPTSKPKDEFSESTPYFVELEEHTHKSIEEITPEVYHDIEISTPKSEQDGIDQENQTENIIKEMETSTKDHKKTTTPFSHHEELDMFHTTKLVKEISTEQSILAEKMTTPYLLYTENQNDVSKLTPVASDKETTTAIPIVTTVVYDKQETPKYEELTTPVSDREKENRITTNAPYESGNAIHETTPSEKEFIPAVTKSTTIKITEDVTISPTHFDKFTKPDEKLVETAPLSTSPPELQKPGGNEVLPTDDIPSIDEDNHFPPTGTSGYGQEPDYVEEDQAFGPGTCRYGGKVYVSAQQIPRDDPCDFCFCFRSDIICLQQSCPPPIHGCHEEPIQGFCCPRYECPVSMATTLNITTTTTTTTTTLPPHFLPHAYKGAAQRRGCQIKGHTYKVGEVVRASSGPCLHCTCGGDGQMKCDPKACTPEPMLRQMIAAAVSAKRRR